MRAIKLTVDFRDWRKLDEFLDGIKDDDTFVHSIDNTSALIVTEGSCGMCFVQAHIADTFEDADIEDLK